LFADDIYDQLGVEILGYRLDVFAGDAKELAVSADVGGATLALTPATP
jgi:hypothetical protein